MKSKSILSFLLLFVFQFLSIAQVNLDKEKLDSYLESLGQYNKSMLSLSISHNNQIIYEKSIGYASQEDNQLSNSSTIYRIGSISKVFTAVMVFQLIEEGKLTLDTKLSKFYPGVKNAEKITVSNLLNHSSGIFNMTNTAAFRTYMVDEKTKPEMVEMLEGLTSNFEPGTKSDYSNSGFVLLGFIVEDLTNTKYSAAVKERVIDKIGLKRTQYGTDIDTKNNEALPYQIANKKWQPVTVFSDMSIPGGAGAMTSTPTELTKFIEAIFDGTLVSSQSLIKMKEINNGYGSGLFEIPFNEKKGYGHGGAIDFFFSNLVHYENDNLSIAITINGLNESSNDILIAALKLAYDMPFDQPDFSVKPISLPEETLSQYEGLFSSESNPLKITLNVSNGQLTAQATGQGAFILTPYSEKEFRFEQAGIVIEFTENSGSIDYSKFMLKQGGNQFEFKKD